MTNRPTWTTITITHLGRKGLNVKPAQGQKEFSQMSETSNTLVDSFFLRGTQLQHPYSAPSTHASRNRIKLMQGQS